MKLGISSYTLMWSIGFQGANPADLHAAGNWGGSMRPAPGKLCRPCGGFCRCWNAGRFGWRLRTGSGPPPACAPLP